MNDDNTSSTSAPSSSSSPQMGRKKTNSSAQGLARILLVVFFLAFIVGGTYAQFTLMAAMNGIGLLWGGILALLFSLILPFVLSVRAMLELHDRNKSAVLQRLAGISLVVLVHLAAIGVVFEWVGLKDGEVAATAFWSLEKAGGVPLISGILQKKAVDKGAITAQDLRRHEQEKKGEAADILNVDAGLKETFKDEGRALQNTSAKKGNAAQKKAGNSQDATAKNAQPKDAGMPSNNAFKKDLWEPEKQKRTQRFTDAGTALDAKDAVTEDAGEDNVTAVSLGVSARKNVLLSTIFYQKSINPKTIGEKVFFRLRFLSDGKTEKEELAFASPAPTTALRKVNVHHDGDIAFLFGAHEVWQAKPNAGISRVEALCASGDENQERVAQVHDVVAGENGVIIAIADVLKAGPSDENNLPVRALVSTNSKGALKVHRRAGAHVPDTQQGKARDFQLRAANADGSFLLVETFSEEGKGVRPDLSGKKFKMNPERLLSSHTLSPGVLVELARTGQHAQGMPRWTLQAFSDAKLLPDGRALFDANFMEDGKRGWVFIGDANGILQPVHKSLFARQKIFGQLAPRARFLDVNAQGDVLFLDKNDRVQLGSISSTDFKISPKQWKVNDEKGVASGVVASIEQVFLGSNGRMLLQAKVRVGEQVETQLLTCTKTQFAAGAVQLLERNAFLAAARRDPLWLLP